MRHPFSADRATQLEEKVWRGKGERRHFRTQLVKRKNKLHLEALLESFLLTNTFSKEKAPDGFTS